MRSTALRKKSLGQESFLQFMKSHFQFRKLYLTTATKKDSRSLNLVQRPAVGHRVTATCPNHEKNGGKVQSKTLNS